MTKQQSVNINFTRDEIFYLKSVCVFLSDPKRCTQPLKDITEKINSAFGRLDRKRRMPAPEETPALLAFIESAPPR